MTQLNSSIDSPRHLGETKKIQKMNELESVCANLAVAWWTLEEKAASVERMLSDSDFSDFSDFSRSVRDLADCVDVVRTAIAVAEASEFSETNFLAMGLSGVPLELYRCRTNLEFSPSLRRVTSLLARAQTCLESHLVVPWIEQHSVSVLSFSFSFFSPPQFEVQRSWWRRSSGRALRLMLCPFLAIFQTG